MKEALGWLLLAAFGLGLSFDYPKTLRTFLGMCGFLLGAMGFLFAGDPGRASPEMQGAQDIDRPDLHEAIVAESFDRISPLEAATVAGVLHHYRIAPAARTRFSGNALELHAAADLVARASGFPKGLLLRLYHDHWIELRGAPARRIVRRLEQHELVRALDEYPDVG
jgi:hypothetical protein